MDKSAIGAIIEASSKTSNINNVLPLAEVKGEGSHDEFCLGFAERVARRFLNRELDFQTADAAMNWLFAFSYVTDDCPGEMPLLAREVFEAFDAGEYIHPNDDPNDDPVEKYTLPQIKDNLETNF
jgi:hypothetical protein